MDTIANLAISLVAMAPSPATSGLSLIVTGGTGVDFPTIQPFDAICWPPSTNPTIANSEIIRVTLVSTDTFTIVRTMYGTTAQSIAIGWQIGQPVTGNLFYEIENLTIMGVYV